MEYRFKSDNEYYMIGMQTMLNISDNSGVKRIRCIRFYKKTLQSNIKIKSIFIGSIQKVKIKKKSKIKKISKGDKRVAILIRTKKRIKRRDGSSIKFKDNSAVLLDKKFKPIATRILGVVPFEFRKKKTMKILMLAAHSV